MIGASEATKGNAPASGGQTGGAARATRVTRPYSNTDSPKLSIADAAKTYHAKGLAVIPLRHGEKVPAIPEWQSRRLAWDELAPYVGNGKHGLGIVTGRLSGNLAILDFDGDGWAGAYEHFTFAWPSLDQHHAPTVETGRGRRHIWARCPDMPADFTRRTFTRADLSAAVELRGNACQTVAPPSLYKGRPYRWINPERVELPSVPFAELQTWLQEWSGETATAPGPATPGPAAPIPDQILEGGRNATLASLAGTMRRRGMTETEILAGLRSVNAQRCRPPLPVRELATIAQSVARYTPAERLGQRLPTATAEHIAQIAPEAPDAALQAQIVAMLAGEGPGTKLPIEARRREAGRLLLNWLTQNGGFCQSETGQRYYFWRTKRQLFNLTTDQWDAYLYALAGVNPVSVNFAYLRTDCQTAAMQAPRRPIVRLAHYDPESQTLRVSRFDGTVLVLDGDGITEEPNGERVLFDDSPLWATVRPDYGKSGALRWYTTDLPSWPEGEREKYGLALRAWIVSTFFSELCPTRPLLCLHGEKGSGKTMTLRLILRQLFGPLAEVGGVPDRPDGFTAAASHEHLLVLDNLDDFTPWIRDKLARLSTGGEDYYRQLYTDNQSGRIRYRCWLAMTSRTPETLRRDDLADRLLLLPVDRIGDDVLEAERGFLQQVDADRPAWWGDMLATLNGVVKAIRAGQLESKSKLRLADWECVGRLVAIAEGRLETWEAFIASLAQRQSDFLLEGELIADGLDLWLQMPTNHGRAMLTRELYQELGAVLFGERKPSPDWPRGAKGFGMRLANIRRDLSKRYRVEHTTGRGRQVSYMFWPLSER